MRTLPGIPQDYNIFDDIENLQTTKVIFAYNDGDFALHPNANRGAAVVDFVQGTSSTVRGLLADLAFAG